MSTYMWTETVDFFGKSDPEKLLAQYGSPLYVYNEKILRARCRELTTLIPYENFRVNYSAKANTNLSLLRIIREEGLFVDALSPGEIFLELKAGFKPEEILFICNNVSDEEMNYAIKAGVQISVDSLSQLERLGKLNPGGKVAVRINPGLGTGHHEKVITGGTNTKFGIDPLCIDEMKSILARYKMKLVGLNQHIGSLFMSPDSYIEAASRLLEFAENFPDVVFVDFGGGFGIPYQKEAGEKRLDLDQLGKRLQEVVADWTQHNGRKIKVVIEPGRYTVAECGVMLGTVHSIKTNGDKKYIGTDIGFNVLARPMLYDAHHDIEVYSKKGQARREVVTVVGNICESGDVIAHDRRLPIIEEDYTLGILDAGAYGMSMSSNYNCRLRPAEVLINLAGDDVLIRRREVLDDLVGTM